jgi:hypothetical protein
MSFSIRRRFREQVLSGKDSQDEIEASYDGADYRQAASRGELEF